MRKYYRIPQECSIAVHFCGPATSHSGRRMSLTYCCEPRFNPSESRWSLGFSPDHFFSQPVSLDLRDLISLTLPFAAAGNSLQCFTNCVPSSPCIPAPFLLAKTLPPRTLTLPNPIYYKL